MAFRKTGFERKKGHKCLSVAVNSLLVCCRRAIPVFVAGNCVLSMSERGSVDDESVSALLSRCLSVVVLVGSLCTVMRVRNGNCCCRNAGGSTGGVASESLLISIQSCCLCSMRMQSVTLVRLSCSAFVST